MLYRLSYEIRLDSLLKELEKFKVDHEQLQNRRGCLQSSSRWLGLHTGNDRLGVTVVTDHKEIETPYAGILAQRELLISREPNLGGSLKDARLKIYVIEIPEKDEV